LAFFYLLVERGLHPSALPLTVVGSKACHVKASFIISVDGSCLVPSFRGGLWGIIVVLCDVLALSGIVLLSRFCSLVSLLAMYASLLAVLVS
jgi:hypothetical protein